MAGPVDAGGEVRVGPAPYQPPNWDAASPDARLDAGGTLAPDAAPETGPEAAVSACGQTGVVHTSGTTTLDAFPLDKAILVVRRDALLLVGWDGEIKKMLAAPREITVVELASATAGPLVVADWAMSISYSLDLAETGSVALTEECRSAALVEGRLGLRPQRQLRRLVFRL